MKSKYAMDKTEWVGAQSFALHGKINEDIGRMDMSVDRIIGDIIHIFFDPPTADEEPVKVKKIDNMKKVKKIKIKDKDNFDKEVDLSWIEDLEEETL